MSQTVRQRHHCVYCQKLNTLWLAPDDSLSDFRCKRCRLHLGLQQHRKWKTLDPARYIHPLDRQALQALRKIPGIDHILRKLLGLTTERMYRVFCQASSIQVSDRQYAHLDAKLEIVARTLGLPKPEIFVSMGDFGGIEALTMGVENPFVVVSVGLLERLDDAEMLAVLAHEMGHIHCQHLLYKTAADTLLFVLGAVMARTPLATIVQTLGWPVQLALLTWRHKAELSCDRAALLVVQDPDVVMRALAKAAGGSLNDELNLAAFIEQARNFERAYTADFLDKAWTLLLASRSSHPFPVWRISELLKWREDDGPQGYAALVQSGADA